MWFSQLSCQAFQKPTFFRRWYILASRFDSQGFDVPARWSHPHNCQTTWTDDILQYSLETQRCTHTTVTQETGVHVPLDTKCHESFPDLFQVDFVPNFDQRSLIFFLNVTTLSFCLKPNLPFSNQTFFPLTNPSFAAPFPSPSEAVAFSDQPSKIKVK